MLVILDITSSPSCKSLCEECHFWCVKSLTVSRTVFSGFVIFVLFVSVDCNGFMWYIYPHLHEWYHLLVPSQCCGMIENAKFIHVYKSNSVQPCLIYCWNGHKYLTITKQIEKNVYTCWNLLSVAKVIVDNISWWCSELVEKIQLHAVYCI